ncbi:MAG: hypothetical protein WD988_00080 [Candidatus Curtissbacteria bacterium]
MREIFRRDREPTREELIYDQAGMIYRAWHIAEGRTRDILDFNLTEPTALERQASTVITGKPNRSTRNSLVLALEAVSESFDAHDPSRENELHDWNFAKAQVKASAWFARRLRGDNLDPLEYIENTTGLKAEPISQDLIDSIHDEVSRRAAEDLNLAFINDKVLLGFKYDHGLTNAAAAAALEARSERTLQAIRRFLRENLDVSYRTSQENVDAYWSAWSGTDPEGSRDFLLRQNFNTGQQRVWTPGRAEELGIHEPQHLARMAKRKSLIRDKKLNSFFGLTTVHGPEPAVEEGLAQTLAYFVSEPTTDRKPPIPLFETLSPEGKFWITATLLKTMAYANAHLMLNNPNGYNKEEVVEYIQSNVPWESMDDIEQQIKWRTENPLNQVYLFTYGKGAEMFLHYARALNERGKRILLQNIYLRPYTPAQTESLFQRISNNSSNLAKDQETPKTPSIPLTPDASFA